MDNNVNKDWNQPGTWAEELVQQAKADKKRWMIAFFVILALFFGTNAYWIYHEDNFETIYQDGSGQNNYNNNIGGDVQNVTGNQAEEEQ